MKFATEKEAEDYAKLLNAKTVKIDGGISLGPIKEPGPTGPTGPSGPQETYDASGKGGPTGFGKEAVGSLASDLKGSGARFNAGKVAVDLIPVWIIYQWASDTYGDHATDEQLEALELLAVLADWQSGATEGTTLLNAFSGDWITDCAKVFDYGRHKYAAWNWAKGMAWSVPTGCAVRHLLAILNGEANDVGPQGSGLPHRGHVACNFVMLAQYEQTFREGDDRPLQWLATSKAPDTVKDTRVLLTEKSPLNPGPLSDIVPDFSMPKFTAEGFGKAASVGDSGVEDIYPPPI